MVSCQDPDPLGNGLATGASRSSGAGMYCPGPNDAYSITWCQGWSSSFSLLPLDSRCGFVNFNIQLNILVSVLCISIQKLLSDSSEIIPSC